MDAKLLKNPAIQLLAAAFLGIFAMFAYWFSGSMLCNPQQEYSTEAHYSNSDCRIYERGNVLTCPKLIYGLNEYPKSAAETDNNQYKYGGWGKTFLCESKLSDIAIAFFTYCLILVGIFQAFWLKKTVDAGEQQRADSKEIADRQFKTTERALHFTDMEFSSTHRPKLRLKHIWIATPDGEQFLGRLQDETPITVRLDIVNTGDATAILARANLVTLLVRKGNSLQQRPPYNEPGTEQFDLGGARLEIGMTFTHPVSDGRVLSRDEIKEIRMGEVRFYLVGTVEYWDDARRPRQIAFCRYLRFNHYPAGHTDTGRFTKEDDPDYEYED